MTRSVYEVQRDFALSSGFRSEIIWDSLSSDQSDILKQKIKILIPDVDKKNDAIDRMRDEFFNSIWLQRKYTNRTLLSAIIYVMVTDEQNHDLAKESTIYTCHPVFRSRKCMNSNNSAGCCMIFIDETGRVYQNWNQYLLNNVLPKGTMIAPANGIYTFNNNDEVELEIHTTPKGFQLSQLLEAGDSIAGVGCLLAPGALVLGAPAAVAAASVITVTASTFSIARSVMHLKDRYSHEQSTGFSDPAAKKSWFNILIGVAGFGATGFTQNSAVGGANVGQVSKIALKSLNVSTLIISGTGVTWSIYDLYLKYNNDEEITTKDVLTLGLCLLVFTHSVNNLSIASKVSKHGRGSSVLHELKNQSKSTFDALSKNLAKLNGTGSKFDLIRIVNDIPLKDILSRLYTINSSLIAGGMISILNNNDVEINLQQIVNEYGVKFLHHITNSNSLFELLNAMANYLSKDIFQFLLNLTGNFIKNNVDAIDAALHTFISTEDVLCKIFMHYVSNYTNFNYELLKSKEDEIINEITKYFNSLNPINCENSKNICKVCNGYFYVCDL